MFDLETNERVCKEALSLIPQIHADEDAQYVMKASISGNFRKFSHFKGTPFSCYPLLLNRVLVQECNELGAFDSLSCSLSALWVLFLEYISIIDALQDDDDDFLYFDYLGPAQSLNLAFFISLRIPLIIEQLPFNPEKKPALKALFASTSLEMFSGQYEDIKYTNFMDKNLDPLKVIFEKCSSAFRASAASYFLVTGQEDRHHLEQWLFTYSTVRSVLSDYFDLWVKDFSADLGAQKCSLPLQAGLSDSLWGEKISLLMGGVNFSRKKQMMLRRWIPRTRAVEVLENLAAEKQEEIFAIHKLGYDIFSKAALRLYDECTEMIESLKSIRHYCREEEMPSFDFSLTRERGALFLEQKIFSYACPGEGEKEALVDFYLTLMEYSLINETSIVPPEIMEFYPHIETARLPGEKKIFFRGLFEQLFPGKDGALPENEELLSSAVLNRRKHSYLKELMLILGLLRGGRDDPRLKVFSETLIAHQGINGAFGCSVLETALGLHVLVEFPETSVFPVRKALRYLQETQQADGSWYAGSPAGDLFVSVFCVSALVKGLAYDVPGEETLRGGAFRPPS